MPIVRGARHEDVARLDRVERSAASVFRDAGLAWVADGETMDPALLGALCTEGTLWVAVDERDEPVGFLAAHELDDNFHIAELSVARSHQRQGIGAELVGAAVSHARAAGFRSVTLTTYRDLSWNAPFYVKLGFAEVSAAEAGPAHANKLRVEAEAGHDPSRRCTMAMRLRPG
jgi:GNAT superfamily N-acetyltransferase